MAGKERRSSVDVGGLNLGAGLGLSGLSFGSSSPLASPLQPGDGSFGGKSRSVQPHIGSDFNSTLKVVPSPGILTSNQRQPQP